ncbi:Polysaccharide biosynthesis protein [Marininema mesophilum]|uniref:Polysaccharide biosynthesis protein n=1 Tax=Marininema mesophilum TaxID=1048340 RepID=A0A1H2UP40_9BACL|nr:polysaccharide biosynthesis protein [Marininema mesophilum]SDW57299.1 Polysaccharide biosynthesis protein [Marininema mesophilum]
MKNSTFLVTGGTGSWGLEIVKQLSYHNPKEVRVFSRNETSLVEMQQQYAHDNRFKFIVGDIRDKEELMQACDGVDYVFHLAALKHVPVCEYQPLEAIKTNVLGTQNVIDAALDNKVKKVIYVSTDKVSDPSNTYGITKALGEKLIIHANLRETNTKFICVRSGNVLGSSGSVVPIFKNQIKRSSQIGITDFRMTRFFLTIEQAVQLLFKATVSGRGGETYVMNMPSVKIADLAQVLIESSGKKDIKINEIGVRPGEKLNETLFTESESNRTVYFDQDYYVVLPSINIPGLQEHYASSTPVNMKEYNSATKQLSNGEVEQMLTKGGFLAWAE